MKNKIKEDAQYKSRRLLDKSMIMAETLLFRFPDDNLLRLTLKQDKHRITSLKEKGEKYIK